MSARRLIELYYDVTRRVLRASTGEVLRIVDFPYITFAEQVTVNIQLVTDSALTVYTQLTGTELFEGVIDKEFNTPLLMVQTLNAGFNLAGDWGSSGGTADTTQGQLSLRLNALTDGFKYKIGTKAERPGTQLEILVRDANSNVDTVLAMAFRTLGMLRSIQVTADTAPTGNLVTFTDPETGAQGVRLVNDDGEVLAVFTPAGV